MCRIKKESWRGCRFAAHAGSLRPRADKKEMIWRWPLRGTRAPYGAHGEECLANKASCLQGVPRGFRKDNGNYSPSSETDMFAGPF